VETKGAGLSVFCFDTVHAKSGQIPIFAGNYFEKEL